MNVRDTACLILNENHTSVVKQRTIATDYIPSSIHAHNNYKNGIPETTDIQFLLHDNALAMPLNRSLSSIKKRQPQVFDTGPYVLSVNRRVDKWRCTASL